MPGPEPASTTNRLLAALPDKDSQKILASCERVELVDGDILHEAGARLRHVYFPTGSFISLETPLDTCAGLEVALVGNEGMVGISPLLGVTVSPLNHLVRGAGSALRITSASFLRQLKRSPVLRRRLNLYVYVNMHQMAQTIACTRFHMIDARLARLLLMTHDRSHSNKFHSTHEFLSHMLGVRRVGITKAATSLQKQALIRYGRGAITILDRRGLEAISCGCYVAANELYDRMLGYAHTGTVDYHA